MADIACCNNPYCAIARYCFRALADRGEYQSMVVIEDTVSTPEDCKHFWHVKDKEELKELNRYWRD